MGVKECSQELHNFINSDSVSDRIKILTRGFTKETSKDIVEGLNNLAVTLLKSGKATSESEALQMALDIKDEETANAIDEDKHNAKLRMIRLAQRRLVAQGLEWNSKKIASKFGLDNDQRHKSGIEGAEQAHLTKILGSRGGLLDRLNKLKLKGGKGLNLLRDGKVARQVVSKVMDQDFTDDDIGKLAKAIDEHNDHMIKLYRISGVRITKLLGRVAKQYHDPLRMLHPKGLRAEVKRLKSLGAKPLFQMDLKENAAYNLWKDFITTRLDKDATFEGKSDSEIDSYLRNVWDGITRPNKKSDVVGGSRKSFDLATRISSKKRSLFFKDGNAYMDYQEKYGAGNLMEALNREAHTQAKNMALVERWGPDPMAAYNTLRKEIVEKDPLGRKGDKHIKNLDRVMRFYSGQLRTDTSAWGQQVMNNIQSLNRITKLGSVVLHSLNDPINEWARLRSWEANLTTKIGGVLQSYLNMFPGKNAQKEFAETVGCMTKHMMGNRFVSDPRNINRTLHKLENLTFTASGQNRYDGSLKIASFANSARVLAKSAHLSFDQLKPGLREQLSSYDFTPGEWEVWRKQHFNADKTRYMSPDSLLDSDPEELKANGVSAMTAYNKALGMLFDQYRFVVPTNSALERANRAARMATPAGAAVNMLLQFKSYALGFTRNVLMRDWQLRKSNTAGVLNIASTIAGTAVLGYLSVCADHFIKNESMPVHFDPLDSDKKRAKSARELWARAMLPALGLYGDGIDALTSAPNRLMTEIAGPTASGAEGLLSFVQEMAKYPFESPEEKQRKSLMLQTEQIAAKNLPFLNTPYAQVMLNWFVGKAIQDGLQPGSFEEHQQKIERETGQTPLYHQ